MAAPLASETLELGVGGLPLVQSQGLNTNQAVNFSGTTVDTSGNISSAGTIEAVSGNLTVTAGNIVLTANSSVISFTGTGANGGLLTNLYNTAATTLAGTQRDIKILIGTVPYYFTVYPTKS